MRNRQMRRNDVPVQIRKFTALVAVVALCASCGGGRFASSDADSEFRFHSDNLGNDDSGSNNTINNGSDGGSDDTGCTLDPYEFSLTGIGYDDDQCVSIPADTLARVRVEPQITQTFVEGTGFIATYGHLGVYITGDSEQDGSPTHLMSNGYLPGDDSEWSSIFTLTSEIENGLIEVCVKKPNYDFHCLWSGICNPQWTHVHTTHPWEILLQVETEDTCSLESTN